MNRRGTSPALCLVTVVLLAVAPAAVLASSQPPLQFQISLPKDYYWWDPVDTAAANNMVTLEVQSNVSVSTAFMTAAQFKVFNASTTARITSAIYEQNGTYLQHTLDLVKGDYDLVFFAPSGKTGVSFSIDVYPNNPYLQGPLPSPEPTGIGTFGIVNDSGTITSYSVKASEVVGVADIGALEAYNGTASKANSTVSGATLQLNAGLVVNGTKGGQQVYWVQNTPTFLTHLDKLAYSDSLWNYTYSDAAMSNTTVSSPGGFVYSYSQMGATQYYYTYEGKNLTYAFPLAIALMVKASVLPGRSVLVQSGAQVLGNGTAGQGPVDWFDNVTIHTSGANDVYFLVDGNATTPTGSFYDAELVFGGEANGESTAFTQMGASLGLFYANGTTGPLTPFPSYYSFGLETAESADNVHVAYAGNGFVQVFTGTPNYVYLGTAGGTITLAQAQSTASQDLASIPSSSETTTVPTTTTSSSSSGVPEFAPQLGVAVLATILAAAAYLVARRPAAIEKKRQ